MKFLVQPETMEYCSNTIYFPIPQMIWVVSQILLQLFNFTFLKILDLSLVSEDADLCNTDSREISIPFLRLISKFVISGKLFGSTCYFQDSYYCSFTCERPPFSELYSRAISACLLCLILSLFPVG